MYAVMQIILVSGVFFMVLLANPRAFCARASSLLEYASGSGSGSGSQYELGYPWNMTVVAADTASDVPTTSSQLMSTATSLHEIACGKNSESFILLMAFGIFLYGALVLLPVAMLSMRIARYARVAGGCTDCEGSPQVMYMSAGRQAPAVGVPIRTASNVQVVSAEGEPSRPTVTGRPIGSMH